MNIQEIEKKILGLREEIIRNEELYRIKNSPEISDAQFDSLMAELKKLEAKFPQFYNPNSPSLNIGKDYSNDFDSVAHLSPMLSLDNVVNKEDFNDFDNRIKRILELDLSQDLNYVIEPKIDGCGVSAIYENGKLTRILSRGDGTQGDDITRNASFIKNLPYVLKSDKYPIFSMMTKS